MQAAYLLLVADLHHERLRAADHERLVRSARVTPPPTPSPGRGRRFRAILADLAGAVRSTAAAGRPAGG